MSKTIKYIGSINRWPELAVTGRQAIWHISQQEQRPDSEANLLLQTGLFSQEAPVSDPRSDIVNLRQVASHCRYPNVQGTLKQAVGFSPHFAGKSLSGFRVGFSNYSGLNELVNTAPLLIMTALEYPLGVDALQFFTYGGAITGSCEAGGDILSDYLPFLSTIPEDALFRLWHWHGSATGIQYAYNGPQPMTVNAANAMFAFSGTIAGNLNYLMTQATAAQRATIVNQDASTNLQLVPICIVAPSTRRAAAFLGDSRSSGQNLGYGVYDYVSDATFTAGASERVWGKGFKSWINLSQTADSAAGFLTGTGAKRMQYLKYVTDVVNGYGTNGLGGVQAAVLGYDAQIKALPFVTGKKFWGITIPPQTTSTDQFTTLAGQTVSANEANRLALNAQRRANVGPLYDGVLDYAALVEDAATGKWLVSPQGRTVAATMAAGSNVVTLTAGAFTAADNGQDLVIVGAGTAAAALPGMAVYVDATHANLVNRITGAAINCVTAVTAAVTYAGARRYSPDGTHETQYSAQIYRDNLTPVV